MGWPQYVMAAWLLFTLIAAVRKEASDRHQTSGMATLGIFVAVAILVGLVVVLHFGGFW